MREKLVTLLKPSVEALGFEFWGLELLGAARGRALLRVYIDHESGVSVDDCEKVSRQLSRLLDVENPLHGEYILEISSPGLERSFFYAHQYPAYCGTMIALKTLKPLEGQRNFKGLLLKVLKDHIVLQGEEKEWSIDFNNIQKAHVVVSNSKE